MNICFFTENYDKGGMDTFLINLFNTWPDPDDNLTLLCNASHSGIDVIVQKTTRIISINKYYRIFTSKVLQGRGSIKFFRVFFVRKLFSIIYNFLQYPIIFPWYVVSLALYFRKSDFDRLMVVTGGYPASLLCRSAAIAWRFSGKRPLAIFNFHSSATISKWCFSGVEHLIDKLVIQSSGRFISVSKACLDTLSVRKAFQNCDKLEYIFNGIDDPFKRLEPNFKKNVKTPNDSYGLMLATYTYYKGHSYLFEALRDVLIEHPDFKLKIYGYGSNEEKQRVASEAKKFGVECNVMLNDFSSDVASLIAGASLLVVPSQAYESFGLTIIEAMAFSTPVVATNVGGIPEVLRGSNAGYICPKDSPLLFASAIKAILVDQMLSSRLGENGRNCFEQRFTAQRMSFQYNQYIKKGVCKFNE